MPREKESYRDNLCSILEFTENRHALNIKTVSEYLGMDVKVVKARFPFKDRYISAETLARELS